MVVAYGFFAFVLFFSSRFFVCCFLFHFIYPVELGSFEDDTPTLILSNISRACTYIIEQPFGVSAR